MDATDGLENDSDFPLNWYACAEHLGTGIKNGLYEVTREENA